MTTPSSTVREQIRDTLEGMLLEHDNEPADQQGPAFIAAVDALVQIVEASRACKECATFHSFHASDPFDALSQKAP